MERVEDKKLIDRHDETVKDDDHTLVLTEPVPESRVRAVQPKEDGQSPLQAIIMIIGAIILVILLVLLARWIYHAVHHTDQTTTGVTIQAPNESGGSNKSGANKQPSGSSNPAQGGNTTSTSNKNGKNLANTGPGNVVAIFAGSTLAAAGLHYIISVRKQAREN